MKVRYSYLPQQFADIDSLLAEIKRFVPTGDFTLGGQLTEFERRFAALIGTKHAIGVASGTDAIKLPLKALGVGHGDEVVTAANTFIATVGAIAELGAKPVFVDCDDTYCMDVSRLEAAITPRTKAIVPVHFTGYMVEMAPLIEIARRRGVPVVEDACQGILAD
ncbi:MAG: aminotransferase class V-fold PLP-dependent enzyme, partial [Azospirillum sp.]|nr:aminotransferase class V-fold PLP-dependent enzyme [Azospirillum sp.]